MLKEMFCEDDKVEIIHADDKNMIGKRGYIFRCKQYANLDSPVYQLCGIEGWWRERYLKKV